MKSKKIYLLILASAIVFCGCGSVANGGEDNGGDSRSSGTSGVLNKKGSSYTRNNDKKDPADTASSPNADNSKGTDSDSNKPGDKIKSIYTDIDEKKCRTIENNQEKLKFVMECAGVAEYKLELDEYDERQTINIIYPDGKKHDLRFHKVVYPSFSYTGKKAEWRVVKKDGQTKPIALIVRFTVSMAEVNPENPAPDMSYLTVSKIMTDGACVTDAVKPVKDQNVKARKLADSSADKPCLKEYPWLPEGD